MREGEEEDVPVDHPSELVLCSVSSDRLLERIPFDHFYNEASPCGEVSGGLEFDVERQRFVAFGSEHDTVVTNRAGEVLMTSPERLHGFCVASQIGWRVVAGKQVVVAVLSQDAGQ